MKRRHCSSMRKRFTTFSVCLLVTLGMAGFMLIPGALAQESEPTLQVRLSKDFGYALGSRIQGAFSVRVSEDSDLVQITLWIDGQRVGVDDTPPFRITFNTSEFAVGKHSIMVIGMTTNGLEVSSPTLEYEFLSAEEARSDAFNVVIPILGVVLAVMLISSIAPVLSGRGKKRFQLGTYGSAGGAVCSRCALPFSRHMLSLNLGWGKLERCPHCGKWALVRRASSSELDAAEARMKEAESQGSLQSEDETDHLQRLIDESRYETDD
ncbi:MAG TPA: hypothetical protein G4O08_03955 [Anaerolineae bacterium]|nr:hypothetical protein [Anaerolineae bacterium]